MTAQIIRIEDWFEHREVMRLVLMRRRSRIKGDFWLGLRPCVEAISRLKSTGLSIAEAYEFLFDEAFGGGGEDYPPWPGHGT